MYPKVNYFPKIKDHISQENDKVEFLKLIIMFQKVTSKKRKHKEKQNKNKMHTHTHTHKKKKKKSPLLIFVPFPLTIYIFLKFPYNFPSFLLHFPICGVIKQNKSELANYCF